MLWVSAEAAGAREGDRKQSAGVGLAALLFDHMLVDHSGNDGQCDDAAG